MAATTTTTNAAFQIMQDAGKENPRNIPTKGKSNVLQPLGASSMGAGGGVPLKQGRANVATLNSNANVRIGNGNNNNGVHAVAGTKVAFREVGNVKICKDDQTLLGGKKASVVPVEQFKTFSVYEDHNENIEPQQVVASSGVPIKQNDVTSQDVVDKENVFHDKQQRLQQHHNILTERSDIHKFDENEYLLDTTPMSVSDVLSPMSVDRSAAKFFDDSNSKEVAESSELEKLSIPRNDRQRFFEVVEYQRSILEYFRESEKKHRPKPHYMRRQTDINYSMRTILVDWLVEVSEEYNLDTETLYISVSYIDRFLSHMSVVRNKLQLVGTAAMYIASKYEEIYPPDVAEFVFITDDTYSKAQVLRMEQIILKILSFDLCTPTAFVFINTYAVLTDIPDKVKFLTLYISELSLLEADPYLRFYPSMISAASLALARYLCDLPVWSAELEEITTYRLEDLREVFLCLCKSHNSAVSLAQQAIQEKYKAEKFRSVSSIEPVNIEDEQFAEIVNHYNEYALKQKNSVEQITTAKEGDKTTAPSSKVNLFFKF
ncbi:G2/mitotic-specific cyclin-A [Stomoxys calcitrans]|uniref:G2/mitotic-specific cyclin-A n=1 Tax=Stomoxys calcitrans TaxID=35570 RepID=UPI0027E22837|nr:G2/mitotic-specific cyclin-A [Stomoxys calcitrans]XP_013111920.2 G2/mitotic-specific cyclin-A [Stomoxys calcitrans]